MCMMFISEKLVISQIYENYSTVFSSQENCGSWIFDIKIGNYFESRGTARSILMIRVLNVFDQARGETDFGWSLIDASTSSVAEEGVAPTCDLTDLWHPLESHLRAGVTPIGF